MADFNLNDPSTFSVSSPRGNFAGSYYYTIAVTPTDPSTYQGPPYFTVTSSELLTEEQILDRAMAIARSRRGKSFSDQDLGFEIINATINRNLR